MVRDEDEAICIDQVDGRHPIRLSAMRGRRLALYAGASPRVLLAFAPDEIREDYLARCVFIKHASGTIMDAARLRTALAEIQQRGYAAGLDRLDGRVLDPPLGDNGIPVLADVGQRQMSWFGGRTRRYAHRSYRARYASYASRVTAAPFTYAPPR